MKTKICLNMIVKNESKVIGRCLASVKNIIDYWVIVDTGSIDGTQEVIKKFLKEIPGELHERPWVHFSHNRNEALALAKEKAEYLLFVDADEVLQLSDTFIMPSLDKDFYTCSYLHEDCESQRVLLVKNGLDWKWHWVLHEELKSESQRSGDFLEGIVNVATAKDGARTRDPLKFRKEMEILEKELKKDPENPRYTIHFAISCASAGEHAIALKNYEKRAQMGGNKLEIFFSLYQIAALQQLLGMAPEIFLASYCRAFEFHPLRAEPLFYIIDYFISLEEYFLGYLVAKWAIYQPYVLDHYFTKTWIYEWGLLCQYVDCCTRLGKKDEATHAVEKLRTAKKFPSYLKNPLNKIYPGE